MTGVDVAAGVEVDTPVDGAAVTVGSAAVGLGDGVAIGPGGSVVVGTGLVQAVNRITRAMRSTVPLFIVNPHLNVSQASPLPASLAAVARRSLDLPRPMYRRSRQR